MSGPIQREEEGEEEEELENGAAIEVFHSSASTNNGEDGEMWRCGRWNVMK